MEAKPHWLAEPALQAFFAATRAAGGEARVVGGAVRDHLLARTVGDVDIASTLTPEENIAMARTQGWKAVPTGIAHGTVLLVLPQRPLEVTTLRRDVQTHGRHATVAYTDNWAEDAARRDFTVNALFMDAEGALHDYGNGAADISARRLRFIGDATTRITEDALRILRYFRFLAVLGWQGDTEAQAACAAQVAMVRGLSGERIAQEMRKLLNVPHPLAALAAMESAGLAPLLTGCAWRLQGLEQYLALEQLYALPADPMARLMALLPAADRAQAAPWIGERWKLSRHDRQALEVLALPYEHEAAEVKAWLRKQARPLVQGRILLQAVDGAAGDIVPLVKLAQDWAVPQFPVTAKDLLARGYAEGPQLGAALKALEQRWVQSDYTLTREELLEA